jgi:hypothetical protein
MVGFLSSLSFTRATDIIKVMQSYPKENYLHILQELYYDAQEFPEQIICI